MYIYIYTHIGSTLGYFWWKGKAISRLTPSTWLRHVLLLSKTCSFKSNPVKGFQPQQLVVFLGCNPKKGVANFGKSRTFPWLSKLVPKSKDPTSGFWRCYKTWEELRYIDVCITTRWLVLTCGFPARHGGTPIAGWSISWKNPISNGWLLWVPPFLEPPNHPFLDGIFPYWSLLTIHCGYLYLGNLHIFEKSAPLPAGSGPEVCSYD